MSQTPREPTRRAKIKEKKKEKRGDMRIIEYIFCNDKH
jgi:hypothetical protein